MQRAVSPPGESLPQEYAFLFKGRCAVADYYTRDISYLIEILNEEAPSISSEIERWVGPYLPSGVSIKKIEIEFFAGSIEWLGLVFLAITALDWISRVSGTMDFLERVAKSLQFAIEGSVRKSIGKYAFIQHETFQTTVVPPLVFPQSDSLPSTLQEILRRQHELSRLLQIIIQNQNLIIHNFIQRGQSERSTPMKYWILALLLVLFIIFQIIAIIR